MEVCFWTVLLIVQLFLIFFGSVSGQVSTQIPQSLKILPSDTEAQKAAKKKKLHSLQCLIKKQQEEEEGKRVQQNWLQFKNLMESKKGKKHKALSKP